MDYESKTVRQLTITLTDKEALQLVKEIGSLVFSDNTDALAELCDQLRDFARGFFDDAPALEPVWDKVEYVGEVTYKENL